MSTVIFIGGATACGKSTFANELNNHIIDSKKYRRYQGFFDIAKQKGIHQSQIFKQVSSEEVDDWFVNVCLESDIVISDVHYAVQMNRNNSNSNEHVDIYQAYVPTISKNLLQKLTLAGVNIVAIYLSCSPEKCLTRAVGRYERQEKELRTKSLEDAMLENTAERKEWDNIVALNFVQGIELNSEYYSPIDLVNQSMRYLKEFLSDGKKLQLAKKRK